MVISAINSKYPTKAIPGLLDGLHQDIRSYVNARLDVAGVIDVVPTVANSTAYNLVVLGVPITFTSDANANAAEVRDGIMAAINNNAFLRGRVVATASGNNVRITDLLPERGALVVTEADANLALSVVTAGVQGVDLLAGVAVAILENSADDAPLRARLLETGDTAVDVAGPVVHDPVHVDVQADGTGVVPPGRPFNVLEKGTIWMPVEGTPAATDTVHVRIIASGANTVIGAVRNDVDGGNAISMAARCKFIGAAENGLIKVKWNY